MPLSTPNRPCAAWLVFLLVLLTTRLATPAAAQAPRRAPLTGTVQTAAGTTVEFATVTLHRAADSAVVKTEFSDGQGHFGFEAPSGVRYRVSASQVGFARYWSPPVELPTTGLVLPAIVLTRNTATALKEVTVRAHRPLFEHRAGRTVVNVAESPIGAGATALDVLGRAPGVTLGGNDNLGLRGREGLLVVLDGKRVPLTGAALADLLRALPAEQIENIELLTNPPARFDSQGGAGVVLINLKKDQRQGTNGTANVGYGRGEFGKFTAGLALNRRSGKANLYGNYAYADRRGFLRVDIDRQFAATDALPPLRRVQTLDQTNRLQSHSGKAGVDYALSKRTLLGASVSVLASQANNRSDNKALVLEAGPGTGQSFTSVTVQDVRRPSGAANLNLRHAFADSATARSLSADADYARYHTTRLLDLTTRYEGASAAGTALLAGDQRSSITIQSAKVDYSQPLPGRARFEAGAKATRVRSVSDVEFVNTENGRRTVDPTKSDRFIYDENVNAAYLALSRAAGRTSWQAGLRAEQTNTLGQQAADNARFERHYTQLFPSASVQHTLNERHAVALALSRHIDRPGYGQVSPIRSYVDVTAYRSGNPALRPSTSYNLEASHTYRQKFVAALVLARTDQPITNVVQPAPEGNRLVVNRDMNLTTQDYFALTLTAPLEPAKWWKLYASGTLYYSRFQGNLLGTALDRRQPAGLLTANSTFDLPGGWLLELNGTYQSPEISGFEAVRSRGQVAAGLQKNLWEKRATLRLNMSDIFYTQLLRSTTTFDNFSETFRTRQDTRVVTAAFSYRFGNAKVAAARKRAAGAEEELRRAAGQ